MQFWAESSYVPKPFHGGNSRSLGCAIKTVFLFLSGIGKGLNSLIPYLVA